MVRTTRTACDPKIVWKLAEVRNVSGSSAPNTTITRPQARISPKRESKAPNDGERVAVAKPGDPFLGQLAPLDLGDHDAPDEHEDAVAQRTELIVIRARAKNSCPADGDGADHRKDLLARPHVHSPRGLVQQQQRRLRLEPLAEERLLLVSPTQGAKQNPRVGGPHSPAPHRPGGIPLHSPPLEPPASSITVQHGQRDVVGHREGEGRTLNTPVARHERDALTERLRGCHVWQRVDAASKGRAFPPVRGARRTRDTAAPRSPNRQHR